MSILADAVVPFGSALAGACAGGYISYRIAVRGEKAAEKARREEAADDAEQRRREHLAQTLLEIDRLVHQAVTEIRQVQGEGGGYGTIHEVRNARARRDRAASLAGRLDLERAEKLTIAIGMPPEIPPWLKRLGEARETWVRQMTTSGGDPEVAFNILLGTAGSFAATVRDQVRQLLSESASLTMERAQVEASRQ